jgi:hypothetical protein
MVERVLDCPPAARSEELNQLLKVGSELREDSVGFNLVWCDIPMPMRRGGRIVVFHEVSAHFVSTRGSLGMVAWSRLTFWWRERSSKT